MRNALLIFSLLLLLVAACNKKNDPKFVDKPSDELVKFVIHLSGAAITEYSKYINDEFVEVTTFIDYDTIVEKVTKDATGKVFLKSVYKLGGDGLAVSSIDSSFTDQELDIYRSEYIYENGFWVEKTMVWKEGETITDFYFTRTIENENVNVFMMEEPANCGNRYSYNDEINKLDLSFSNGITGKWSKNLKVHTLWNYGCPFGPSRSIANSDYKYELNDEGYVIKQVETYTPSYHLTDAAVVTRTIKTTVCEYVIN